MVLCYSLLWLQWLTSGPKPRSLQKYPWPIVLKILSIELLEGKVQLKMQSCLFKRCGMSFLPPPSRDMILLNVRRLYKKYTQKWLVCGGGWGWGTVYLDRAVFCVNYATPTFFTETSPPAKKCFLDRLFFTLYLRRHLLIF